MIISTGMATLGEIDAAVAAARGDGQRADHRPVLHRQLPRRPRASPTCAASRSCADAFGVQVGLSDHTLGIGAAVAAVALGACVIEKHVTLKRADGGVDSAFSLEPAELAALVRETRAAWLALGEPRIGAARRRGGGAPVPPLAVRHRRTCGPATW